MDLSLKTYMEHLGLGYEDLALRIDVSSYKIKAWEDGREDPSETDLLALAHALGTSTADILGDSPWDAEAQTTESADLDQEDPAVSGFGGFAWMQFKDQTSRLVPLSVSEIGYLEGAMLADHELGLAGWVLLQGFDNKLVAFHPDAVEYIDLQPPGQPAGERYSTAIYEAMALADRSSLRPKLRAAVEEMISREQLHDQSRIDAFLRQTEIIMRDGSTRKAWLEPESMRPFAMNEFDGGDAVILESIDGTRRIVPENRLAALIMPLGLVLQHERDRVNEE